MLMNRKILSISLVSKIENGCWHRSISITEIISTMRACIEDERMDLERGFLDGLRAADRFVIQADKMSLYQRNELLLTFVGRKK